LTTPTQRPPPVPTLEAAPARAPKSVRR
jgi:hypothetical protein